MQEDEQAKFRLLRRIWNWIDEWLGDRLRSNPMTSFAVVISACAVFGMPQISGIMFDLLSPGIFSSGLFTRDGLLMCSLWLYVATLAIAFGVAVLLLMPPEPDVVTKQLRFSAWLYGRTDPLIGWLLTTPQRLRHRRGIGLLLTALGVGTALSLVLFEFLPDRSPSIRIYMGELMIASGLWLAFGRFHSSDGTTRLAQDYAGRLTRTVGLILVFVIASSIFGRTIWWAIAWDNPMTWRLYALWAIPHICLMLVSAGAFVDSAAKEAEWRILFAVLLVAAQLVVSGLPTTLGRRHGDRSEKGNQGQASDTKPSADWFDAVEARLATMDPFEPVIFVAAAGGGSRAGLFATLVLEALERTPTHGSLGNWSELEPGPSLADRVLFISSVSGGSVATAHYTYGETIADRTDATAEQLRFGISRPKNTLPLQLEARFRNEWDDLCELQKLLCERERNANLDLGRQCQIELRLCKTDDAGYAAEGFDAKAYRAHPKEPPWPIGSKRFDDVATDFNAALMRGFVLPGIERGESMTRFWKQRFQWQERLEKTWQDAALARDRPLLLINLTDVDSGTRIVAGFPPLPTGLAGGKTKRTGVASPSSMRSLGDVHPDLRLSLEEAVRISANFPWGFDLPTIGIGDNERALTIDGGVLDNTGIDSLDSLLRRLELMADRFRNPGYRHFQRRAAHLLDQLAQRGVLLLEIDSGAKPEPPSWLSRRLANHLMPIHSLSMSAHVRSVEATEFYASRMEDILERRAEKLVDDDFERLASPGSTAVANIDLIGRRLSHIVYALDTENLMTAWALSPHQKGQLLARFLREDASQRRELVEEFADIEGANMSRNSLLVAARTDDVLGRYLSELSDSQEELARFDRANGVAAKRRRQAQFDTYQAESGLVNETEHNDAWLLAGYYHTTDHTLEARDCDASPALPGLAPSDVPFSIRCDTDPETHQELTDASYWRFAQLSFCRTTTPRALAGHRLQTTDPVYLRGSLPRETGALEAPIALLPPGSEVTVADVCNWRSTGFHFAKVQVDESSAEIVGAEAVPGQTEQSQ